MVANDTDLFSCRITWIFRISLNQCPSLAKGLVNASGSYPKDPESGQHDLTGIEFNQLCCVDGSWFASLQHRGKSFVQCPSVIGTPMPPPLKAWWNRKAQTMAPSSQWLFR